MASLDQSFKLNGIRHISDAKYAFLNVLTFGILYIVCKLSIRAAIFLKTSPIQLSEANAVVLEDQYGGLQIIKLEKRMIKPTLLLTRYIKNKHCTVLDCSYGRFIYDYKLDKFVSPVHYIAPKKSFDELLHECMVRSREEERIINYEKLIIYGENGLGLKIPSISSIVLDQLFAPLFLWEVISMVIWYSINYIIYLSVVGVIFFVMAAVDLANLFRYRTELAKKLTISTARVFRDGTFKHIMETEILPGDLIYIDNTDNFTCDCEILKGNVITDESFLTGESVPICKGPGSVVYSGTKIIKSVSTIVSMNNSHLDKLVKVKSLTKTQNSRKIEQIAQKETVDDSAIGVVTRTGKRTKRGMLFKNLAIKKPSTNEFVIQSLQVITFLITISLTMLAIFPFFLHYRKVAPRKVIKYSFDVALTFFCPALYTSLELGAQYCRGQLHKKGVNTTDVSRINTAGEVDLIIFDKTGTLTELGVDVSCFDTIENTYERIQDVDINARMALSTCHYVVELDDQYSGDILDMKMFLFSQSKIINKDGKRLIEMDIKRNFKPICKEYTDKEDDYMLFFNADSNQSSANESCDEDTLEVLKIHDFDMYLKRLSVVVSDHTGKSYVFCKGAPDSVKKILKVCPEAYAEKVRDYGLGGYRVLTVAKKEVTEYGNREMDEKDLEFLGFLVLANKLKAETTEVIVELKDANLNPKMCTGDNILTAISVAKECGMIEMTTPVLFPVLEDGCKSCYDVDWFCVADEDYIFDKVKMQLYYEKNRAVAQDFVIAVEAKELDYFKSSNYHLLILEKGVVFARFNPDNKKDLIEEYSKAGFVTMFCGDGANDTGALCSADVGLSLATNEASLAASFNSKSLSSVLDLVKEGRSALSMSAAQFKYIFYSQVMTGFQMLALLPQMYFPSDSMSLINDLMCCYVLAYGLSNFKASKKIHKTKNRIYLRNDALYIFIELLCILAVYILTSFSISGDSRATPRAVILKSRNSGAIFTCTMLLLVYRSLKFANFGPHRQNIKNNKCFITIFSICCFVAAFIIYMILVDNPTILKFFYIQQLKKIHKLKTLACLAICVCITFVFDFLEKKRRLDD